MCDGPLQGEYPHMDVNVTGVGPYDAADRYMSWAQIKSSQLR